MYFSEVEMEHNVPEGKRMNIAHSVTPQIVAMNASWMMKRLLAASPCHYLNWSPDSERRRMEVLVDILSRREYEPRISDQAALPQALHPAVESAVVKAAVQPSAETEAAEEPAGEPESAKPDVQATLPCEA
jgi:hypothetical protein